MAYLIADFRVVLAHCELLALGGDCHGCCQNSAGAGAGAAPAPAVNEGLLLAALLSQHVQPKKGFSSILVRGDAKGLGGPFCS